MRTVSEKGACLVEGAVTLLFALVLLLLSFDLITLFRYSSAAYSIAITTARIGSVEEPGGYSMTVPSDAQLHVPASNTVNYLASWRQNLLGGTAPNLTADIRAALNLGHGWARDLLGPKFSTVKWNLPTDAANNVRHDYEFSIVPKHYQFANATSGEIDITRPADYECCISVPLVILPLKTVCRDATSSRYKL